VTREEWEYLCASVKDKMIEHVGQFVTPISMSEEHGSGVAWGSGGYLAGVEGIWLITANHVFADAPKGAVLAHLPTTGEDYIAITEPQEAAKWPVDVAAVRVAAIPSGLSSNAIPKSRFSEKCAPVESELLFWIGFPGFKLDRHDPILPDRRHTTLYGELRAPGLPMLSQAVQGEHLEHEALHHDKHIAVHYPSSAKRAPDQAEVALPHPKGMSGSLLWNTRFVETTGAGLEWSPDHSQVCGLVWAALDSPEVVLATRIEFVRAALPGAFS